MNLNRSFTLANGLEARLSFISGKLALKVENISPLLIDFHQKSIQRRRQAGKKQGLVSACRPGDGVEIVDLTAGWGKDAAILASFGASVLMIERNPVMAALLEDAVSRLESASLLQKCLSFRKLDAIEFLKSLSENDYPDVIYMDPMHPERKKSALVKKEMQVLQQLIGPDEDALTLLRLAIQKVKKRVVVKWPSRTPPLLESNHYIDGKTVRFDIYLSGQDQ